MKSWGFYIYIYISYHVSDLFIFPGLGNDPTTSNFKGSSSDCCWCLWYSLRHWLVIYLIDFYTKKNECMLFVLQVKSLRFSSTATAQNTWPDWCRKWFPLWNTWKNYRAKKKKKIRLLKILSWQSIGSQGIWIPFSKVRIFLGFFFWTGLSWRTIRGVRNVIAMIR